MLGFDFSVAFLDSKKRQFFFSLYGFFIQSSGVKKKNFPWIFFVQFWLVIFFVVIVVVVMLLCCYVVIVIVVHRGVLF